MVPAASTIITLEETDFFIAVRTPLPYQTFYEKTDLEYRDSVQGVKFWRDLLSNPLTNPLPFPSDSEIEFFRISVEDDFSNWSTKGKKEKKEEKDPFLKLDELLMDWDYKIKKKNKINSKKLPTPEELLPLWEQIQKFKKNEKKKINKKNLKKKEKKNLRKLLVKTKIYYAPKMFRELGLIPKNKIIQIKGQKTYYVTNLKCLQNAILSYNIFFNFFFVFYAFGDFLDLFKIRELNQKILGSTDKKSLLTQPFEDFINNFDEQKEQVGENQHIRNIYDKYLPIRPRRRPYKSISVLFSLYMGKKNMRLVKNEKEDLIKKHKELISRDSKINQHFYNFLSKYVESLFSDFSYRPNPYVALPNSSYYYEGENIMLHDYIIESNNSDTLYEDYLDFLINDKKKGIWSELFEKFMKEEAHVHSVKVITDKGKSRVITTNHPATCLMKGLQQSIHGFLKRKPEFRYIGAQVAQQMWDRKIDENDWLISGDYSNSTDFIPREYTHLIYKKILEKISGHQNLKGIVWKSLRKEILIYPDDSSVELKSGQLMGGLLSFPALCIMNSAVTHYCGFRQKKINGDDLLGIADKKVYEKWCTLSESLGLKVNRSKSHICKKWATFNSQLIMKQNHKLIKIPHFQVSKLAKAGLNDFLNLNLFNKWNFNFMKKFSKLWFKRNNFEDLFTGDLYEPEVLEIIGSYYPNFQKYYDELIGEGLLTLKKVGGFSKGYSENIFEMLNYNWSHLYSESEDFVVGNGVVSFLKQKETEEEFKKFLKNKKNPMVHESEHLLQIYSSSN